MEIRQSAFYFISIIWDKNTVFSRLLSPELGKTGYEFYNWQQKKDTRIKNCSSL